MRNCFVPGCDRRQKSNAKRSMFTVPKDPEMFAKWVEVLPKLRPLKNNDRICHLHFSPDEIQKSFEHVINGDIYLLERDRIRLKAHAIPSLNLPSVENLLSMKQIPRTRKQLNKFSEVTLQSAAKKDIDQKTIKDSKVKIINVESIQTNTEHQLSHPISQIEEVVCSTSELQPDEQPELLDSNYEHFNNLYDDVFEVNLPNTLWGVHRCPGRSVIMFVYMDAMQLNATKMLTLERSGELKVILASRLMNTSKNPQTIESLSELLATLDEIRICAGVNSSPECEVEVSSSKVQRGHTEEDLCGTCLLSL